MMPKVAYKQTVVEENLCSGCLKAFYVQLSCNSMVNKSPAA